MAGPVLTCEHDQIGSLVSSQILILLPLLTFQVVHILCNQLQDLTLITSNIPTISKCTCLENNTIRSYSEKPKNTHPNHSHSLLLYSKPLPQLLKTFACYLSTSAGPVMGVLYLSTAKLAFCSDNPLSYTAGEQTQWSYYKVVIPLHQLRTVNPSTSKTNPSEKYIQIISVDNHEFWFMGFVHYDSAVKNIQGALQPH
ncbi:hypothetical protein TanjilG_28439 [Lupinus angustifolius]|uniref:GRAM domain-containing protein n=1 Tax=Lupinus angustifolius TaxID=3871 RepID=A0A1J7G881_LUPAN|nr:hypothetical protein TanjilG_28439 [Lupinus angustifolius]